MIAVDTNVLVYAVDINEPLKGPKAVALLQELESQPTVLLWQVVCEFGAVLVRKRAKSQIAIDLPDVLNLWLGLFPLVSPGSAVVHTAWRLMDVHQMSYWDSFLVAACIDAGVDRLYTEDLQSMPVIEGVQIINPFA